MENKLTIKVSGRRIERFIKRLLDNNIDIYNLIKNNNEEIIIDINYKDYSKIRKIKTIYKIKVLNYKGFKKIGKILSVNKMPIFVIFCNFILLLILSNIIFSIKVIHNNPEIQSLIFQELSEYGIKVHKFKKSDLEIKKIKEEILEKHKNKIEWLEIEERGTSYIIRVEERLIPEKEEFSSPRSIVASKSAVIKKISASSGVIEKEVGQYVKKGEVLINGEIKLGPDVKSNVVANGTVFGEVWYTVKVKYPYILKEKHYTGNVNNSLMLNVFNKKINVIGQKYTNFERLDKISLSSTFIPIFLSYGINREVKIIDTILTEEEAYDMAIERSKKEMEAKFKEGEYIIDFKVLDMNFNENNIELNIFYSICENITEYLPIS